jgi:BASS family bile acid:Na+ symporter
MEALQESALIALQASLLLIVLAIGLDASFDDASYVLRRPKLLLRAVAAINVVVPAFAVLMAAVLPLAPVVKAGVVLMAVSPLPPVVSTKEFKLGGRKRYVIGLLAAVSVLAILIVPLTAALLGRAFGAEVSLPPGAVARVVLTSVFVPLGAGMVVRRLAPSFAERAKPIVSRLANTLLILGVLPLLVRAWPAMLSLIGNGTVLAIAVVVIAGLVAGHLLGGPNPHDRITLAIASASRHPGIAMLIAGENFADPRVKAAILLFLVVGLIVSTPYLIWSKRRYPPLAGTAAGAGEAD